jgi:hypothetical protein
MKILEFYRDRILNLIQLKFPVLNTAKCVIV